MSEFDRLVRSIRTTVAAQGASLPGLLAAHWFTITRRGADLLRALDDPAPGASLACNVARTWVLAERLTHGAFAQAGGLSPFGVAILNRVSLVMNGIATPPEDLRPSDDELLRLDAVLALHASTPDLPDPALALLARLCHVALAAAWRAAVEPRRELIGTADLIARTLAERYSGGRSAETIWRLDVAIRLWRAGLRLADDLPALRAPLLSNEAAAHRDRYDITGDPEDLRRALAGHAAAEASLTADDAAAAGARLSQAIALAREYERTNESGLLDRMLALYDRALAGFTTDPVMRSRCLQYSAYALAARHQRGGVGSDHDLENALARMRMALDLLPEGEPSRRSCLHNYAVILRNAAQAQQATAPLDEAIAVLRQLVADARNDQLGSGRAWAELGATLMERYRLRRQSDWLAGADLAEAVRAYASANAWLPPDTMDGLLGRMEWANALAHGHETGIVPPEEDALERAITIHTAVVEELAVRDAPVLLQKALIDLAACQRLARNDIAVHAALARAVPLHEELLTGLPDRIAQQRRFGSTRGIYEMMIDACLNLADASTDLDERRRYEADAWRYAERAKARLTVQRWQHTALAAAPAPAEDARLAKIRALAECRRQLDELFLAAGAVADGAGGDVRPLRSLRGELAAVPLEREGEDAVALRTKEAQLWDELRAMDATLARLQRVPVPDLESVQSMLRAIPDGAVLVELVPHGEELLVFILDGRTLQLHRLAVSRELLEDQTLRFLTEERTADGVRRDVDFVALEAALAWLGGALAPALADALRRLPGTAASAGGVGHCLLVPTGALHLWPLHALPLAGRSSERLLDRAACAVLPAADALPVLANQPVFPGGYTGLAPATNLPFARFQVLYEASFFSDCHTFLGGDASFDALRQRRGGVVTFATHGVVDLLRPERSAIDLAGPDGKTRPVTALEFAVGLDRMHCGLLGLTACETHGAGVRAGDTWAGISQAFLRAGRCLLASLWRIWDASALPLAAGFWPEVRAGLTIPQALRQATRALRDADGYQLHRWGEQILAALQLPAEEAQAFREAWADATAATSDPIAGASVQPFQSLAAWAPYLVIGWPGPLPAEEL